MVVDLQLVQPDTTISLGSVQVGKYYVPYRCTYSWAARKKKTSKESYILSLRLLLTPFKYTAKCCKPQLTPWLQFTNCVPQGLGWH